ncbi:geranylgeranyl pyrophosphate synthase [Biomphalaria glabrata]|uniref:Geranylgeranyl pyrophosphate synthase-like n=1 Tax=Biomphalaria glabrata TaxID=6526 RepID=A0A2C9JG89_BIOGL|nr:geranylgeranyl pyrophosphate synthase-like [Biomphalaria glabrata]XP_055876820.1 geranylgeranyl pyrophosphate synthase-like [Biomphalaria glabrata]KAI8765222.1 geranylgeranyl pyrophosphate synthase-like [Biomphalaria glabrata]KAI8797200.1 geranylgeranyl pyrophosphate synthase [Biomphalaria glabrata]
MDSSLSEVENDETKDKHEQILMEPYKYISQIPGKQIRTQLAVAFNYWLKIPVEKQQIVSEVAQMLHNASLIVDDIEDNSKLRRGIPVTHSIFGVAQAINSANYVYFLGLEKLFSLGKLEETSRIFTEHCLELHRGQGMDIYWRDAVICPTEDEYKLMVLRKTGALFGLAVKLMQLFSTNKSDLNSLLRLLGLYFQIRDDYANLCSKEYEANKSYCEDITEGKFSFPLIHAIRSNPNDNQVLSILRQRTTDNDVKKYCVQYLEKVGSFDYTRKVLAELESELLQNIESLGGNPYLKAIVLELRKIYSTSEDC